MGEREQGRRGGGGGRDLKRKEGREGRGWKSSN